MGLPAISASYDKINLVVILDSEGGKELLKQNSLLFYKQRPARLAAVGERLEIEVEGGEKVRVRPKDVVLLHPGPVNSLAELQFISGEVQAAWEILAGESTSLSELSELIYGRYTPVTAWSAWQHVVEGLYFEGTPDRIQVRTGEEVARLKQERDQAGAAKRAWAAFIDHARKGEYLPADRDFLRDVENLAFGRSDRSQVLRELGRSETPENAHHLLLELKAWDININPYPVRYGVTLKQVDLPVLPTPPDERRDLTHLPAYAIDDEGTDTPDDALSLDGSRLWVHVADPSIVVEPDSPLDLEARERSMSLHLPEGTVHLLPREVTLRFGLGLLEVSPALSFGIDLNGEGEVTGFEIVPSQIRVTRLTYEGAEQLMDSEPFLSLERMANLSREKRRENGAIFLDFPEVRVEVDDEKVSVRPLPPLRSRAMVEEAMILTGIQTARFAAAKGLLLPFNQQEAGENNPGSQPAKNSGQPDSLSKMFAMRRTLKRSRYSTVPARHTGLGAPAYTQVTSPLRRYLDLVSHQQLHAFLRGSTLMDETRLLERIGAADAVMYNIRQAETFSEKHWTLVYLMQNPGWRGEGILVEKRGMMGTVIIPSLALEMRVHLKQDVELDQLIPLKLNQVNLPNLEASFRIEK